MNIRNGGGGGDDFLRSTIFKLQSQIKGNSVNYCDIFKIDIFCFGWSSMITLPKAPKTLLHHCS